MARPTTVHLASDDLRGAWHEIVVLGLDDRLRVSANIARRRTWLRAGSELLAVLKSNQVIELLPYDEFGRAIEEQIKSLAALEHDDDEEIEIAIRRRYLRLLVGKDSRIAMPKDVRFCLNLDPVAPSYLRISLYRDSVLLECAQRTTYSEDGERVAALDLP